ncbi:MAG: hypothetical protein CK425_09005 [Parachlamydia sp.]|nr:MAG: hypothetical protein CK425_09005 [Parachlamydia sp.]
MFDILNRALNIHHHYILEASAGTGKTFSIENIIVRLLIEPSPNTQRVLEIQDILVVTFTRAAAHDLKVRIRQNIDKALSCLQTLLDPSIEPVSAIPDYLQACAELDPQQLKLIKKKLEKALFEYDRAQIYTIHSFCMRMLQTHFFEGDLALFALSEEKAFSQSEISQVIHDFFRTEMDPSIYGKAHFQLLLKTYDNSVERLEAALARLITQGMDIAPAPAFHELFDEFNQNMLAIKAQGFTCQTILEDFKKLAPFYTGLLDRKKNLKEEILQRVTRFAQFFDQNEWSITDFEAIIYDQLFLVQALDPVSRNKKAEAGLPSVALKQLRPLLKQSLGHLVNPLCVFAKLAHECQKFLKYYQAEEEKLRYDDLLHAMLKAMHDATFIQKIRETYQAALIDEFQDTDPTQWKIFETLFLEPSYPGSLYLVGDPKQSIYAFRQADIYTYLAASNAIGEENKASLTTNFRSHPDLVEALNQLFQQSTTPHFIYLPRQEQPLPYISVKASTKTFAKSLPDTLGSIHFMTTTAQQRSLEQMEEEIYLPFVANELLKLHQSQQFPYRECAILVSDRYQAQRIVLFLKKYDIPAYCQRHANLADSAALLSLRELLQGILNPRHASSLKIALGGKIFAWSHLQITRLEDLAFYETTLGEINQLRKILLQENFAAFYHALIYQPHFQSSSTLAEAILQQHEGEQFFEEMEQIAELLISQQYETHCPPEGLIAFLDEFSQLKSDEDERLHKKINTCQDAVQILTLHSSKGLEFEIVFVLGLIKQSPVPDLFLPQHQLSPPALVPIFDSEDPRYLSHCQEIDAEKMRQLYVAFTRAKYRLYVAATSPLDKQTAYGCASAMELFLAKLAQPFCSYPELYERIYEHDSEKFFIWLDALDPNIRISYSTETTPLPFLKTPCISEQFEELIAPPDLNLPSEKTFIYSFTSLAKQMEQAETADILPPHDFEASIKTPHTLPAGNTTGILLHEILEHLPFEQTQHCHTPEALLPFITPYTQGTPYDAWNRVLCEVLFKIMKTPFPIDGQLFSLEHLQSNRTYREIEFLYPYENDIFHLNLPKSYFKGVIDLVFEYAGKYHIIDWKSNWLGPTAEAYQMTNLAKTMHAQGYLLQTSIYEESLKRYLKVYDPQDFKSLFGGIYYIFLRGFELQHDQLGGFFACEIEEKTSCHL